MEVVETDLGEYIVQLAHERPFHIPKPAIHMPLDRVRRLFSAAAGRDVGADAHDMAAYARAVLREKFLAADMGITGANFGVAATGSVVLVTNEGNGRMTTTLPRTHVVVMGVERLVPTFADLEAILKVLPRAGVGLRATAYVTAITGPRRAGEADGPQELHVVIVDNGRSRILGGKYEQVLSCIRCGACLDVCPSTARSAATPTTPCTADPSAPCSARCSTAWSATRSCRLPAACVERAARCARRASRWRR